MVRTRENFFGKSFPAHGAKPSPKGILKEMFSSGHRGRVAAAGQYAASDMHFLMIFMSARHIVKNF